MRVDIDKQDDQSQNTNPSLSKRGFSGKGQKEWAGLRTRNVTWVHEARIKTKKFDIKEEQTR